MSPATLRSTMDRRQRRHPRDPSDALGQHGALLFLQDFLLPREHLFAHLDDIFVVCLPDRVGPPPTNICRRHGDRMSAFRFAWRRHRSGIAAVVFHLCCQEMQETAARLDPQARVWRGEGLLTQQRSRVLGIPNGTEERKFGRPQRNTELCSSGFLFGSGSSKHVVASFFLRQSSSQLLGIFDHAEAHGRASLPFQMGGCGLRRATALVQSTLRQLA